MSRLVGSLARPAAAAATTTMMMAAPRTALCRIFGNTTRCLWLGCYSPHRRYCRQTDGNDDDDSTLPEHEQVQVQEFINRELKLATAGHRVLIVQPYIKWGHSKDRETPPDVKLDESRSLVRTLADWSVADGIKVGLTSVRKLSFFGPGHVDTIAEQVAKDRRISAVFVSTNVLKPVQHQHLEHRFRVPVYDRYLMVVQIFRRHAVTREAKLLVALAEVPYVWSRIRGAQPGYAERLGSEAGQIALSEGLPYDAKRDLLRSYEKKLKRSVDRVRSHREHLRHNRRAKDLPVVAVVGYTNAGKTSLVKALTGDAAMAPRDCLFATLDVTVHGGHLPSNLRVLYVDTVGFISDIPTRLIEPFVATLEDALCADVIVHVSDLSHPNVQVQRRHVETTLAGLPNVDKRLLDRVIHVGNKVDRLADGEAAGQTGPEDDVLIPVSCVTGEGLELLKARIERQVIEATGRRVMKIRVRTGQDEYEWLRTHTAVVNVEPDGNHSVLEVVITNADLDVFKNLFIRKNAKN